MQQVIKSEKLHFDHDYHELHTTFFTKKAYRNCDIFAVFVTELWHSFFLQQDRIFVETSQIVCEKNYRKVHTKLFAAWLQNHRNILFLFIIRKSMMLYICIVFDRFTPADMVNSKIKSSEKFGYTQKAVRQKWT